jgi:pyruvyltransferase
MYDLDDLVIRNLQARYPEQVRIIDVKHYSDWHEVVDQILDCELILSSSLHGLIIADAYGVPNVWMKCSDKTFDGAFKYQDYLLSVGRTVQQPFQMSAEQSLEELMALGATYEGAHIDLEPLLKACPF